MVCVIVVNCISLCVGLIWVHLGSSGGYSVMVVLQLGYVSAMLFAAAATYAKVIVSLQ